MLKTATPSQVTIKHGEALPSRRWLSTCLPMAGSELIPHFSLLVCIAFTLPIKLSLSKTSSFLTFTLLVLSLMLLVRERIKGFISWLGLNRATWFSSYLLTKISCILEHHWIFVLRIAGFFFFFLNQHVLIMRHGSIC